ncbi:hypothetical protein LP7551_01506 [Roseibium album]|nr:hypothetical protein LP7551_01506 [Roseibium album]
MFDRSENLRVWLNFSLLVVFIVLMLGAGNLMVNRVVDTAIEANSE